jgi:CubicO group peptidase (beta-lactamase class C family)
MRALHAVSSWPARSAAAGVLRSEPGGAVVTVGLEGDAGRRYAWASITKLCTALAVLVAVEELTVSLDEAAGPEGSTVAHLLAHASGLGPSGRTVLAPPGRRRIYCNAGYELLGELVAERSGMDFAEYLQEAVIDPIGMRGAALLPGASPAAGMEGTIGDLLALGRELLAPTVVSPATLRRATAVAFPGLRGALPGFGSQDPCDWGLGFEIRDAKSPHWTGSRNSPATFGHFGQAGGFLWVDPEPAVACAVLSDEPFGVWATIAWPVLSDAVLEEIEAA